MSIDVQPLVKPELLTESALLEILKSRCIDLPKTKTFKKSELLEMYRRVALPLPQRKYIETKPLGKKLNDLRLSRKITVAIEEDRLLFESIFSSLCDPNIKTDNEKTNLTDNTNSLPKRMSLSNSSGKNGLQDNLKRKIDDRRISAETDDKKRQKISWP